MFGADPTARIALMLRRWRSRIGISAPRVTVRTQLPWHWRALSVIFLAACSLALAGWIYDAGLRFAGFHSQSSANELALLRDQVQKLTTELELANKKANSSDSRLTIESTAQDRLAVQIRSLEEENIRLKADLAVFENLAGNDQGPPSLEISRLQMIPEGNDGRYRFRLLIGQRGGARDREFKGNLQLTVTAIREGQAVNFEFPGKGETNLGQYSVTVRRFGRVEGLIRIPDNLRIQSVVARVLEAGQLRSTSMANF